MVEATGRKSRYKNREESTIKTRNKSQNRRRKGRSKSSDNGRDNINSQSRLRTTSGSKHKKKMEVDKETEIWSGQLNQYSRSFSPNLKKKIDKQRSASPEKERHDPQYDSQYDSHLHQIPADMPNKLQSPQEPIICEPPTKSDCDKAENFSTKILLTVGERVHNVIEASIKTVSDIKFLQEINCGVKSSWQGQKLFQSNKENTEPSNDVSDGNDNSGVLHDAEDGEKAEESSSSSIDKRRFFSDASEVTLSHKNDATQRVRSNSPARSQARSPSNSSARSRTHTHSNSPARSRIRVQSNSPARSRSLSVSGNESERRSSSRKRPSGFNRILKVIIPPQNEPTATPASAISTRDKSPCQSRFKSKKPHKQTAPNPSKERSHTNTNTHLNNYDERKNTLKDHRRIQPKSYSTVDFSRPTKYVTKEESSNSESEFISRDREKHNRKRAKMKKKSISLSGFANPKINIKNRSRNAKECHIRSKSVPVTSRLKKDRSERLSNVPIMAPSKKKFVKRTGSIRTGLKYKE